MGAVTWDCPRCGRRVPLRIEECHCGARRETAVRAAAAPVRRQATRGPRQSRARTIAQLPWPVWAWLGVAGLALALGIAWLFVASPPEPIVPLLGYVDRTPPSPSPSPKR